MVTEINYGNCDSGQGSWTYVSQRPDVWQFRLDGNVMWSWTCWTFKYVKDGDYSGAASCARLSIFSTLCPVILKRVTPRTFSVVKQIQRPRPGFDKRSDPWHYLNPHKHSGIRNRRRLPELEIRFCNSRFCAITMQLSSVWGLVAKWPISQEASLLQP